MANLQARRPPLARWLRPDPVLGEHGARNVSSDLLQSLFGGVFVALATNFAAVYASRLDASPFLLSILLAAPYTGALISPVVVARLPATLSPFSIALFIVVGRLLMLAVPLTNAAGVFVALMVGMFLLASLPSPYVVDVMGRLYPTAVRGRYIGYSRIALTVGLTLGAPVGGYVLDHYGAAGLFPLSTLIGVIGAHFYSRLRPGADATPPARPSIAATFRLAGTDRSYALRVAALAVWGFGALIAGPFYPVMLVNRFGVSYSDVGFLTLIQSLTWFISYLYLARRIDRMPAEAVLGVSMVLSAFLPLTYLLAPSTSLLAIGYAANGFAAGGVDLGLLQVIVRSAPPGRTAQYTALMNAVAGARGIVAPFAGSVLGASIIGTSGLLISATILCLIGAVLGVGRFGRRTGGKPQRSELVREPG